MDRKILTLLMLLPLFFAATAAHLKGGWMEYKYLGATPGDATKSRYQLSVHQYLSCASSGGQIDQQIFVGVFVGSTRVDLLTLAIGTPDMPSRSDFPCVSPVQTVCYRIDNYTTTIDLTNNATGYTFAVQRCSRVAGIINIANSGNTGITYTISIPGVVIGVTDAFKNSSPVFTKSDAVVVCANNSFTFPFVASDLNDSDSLSYRFANGYDIQNCDPVNPVINPPNAPPYPSVTYQGAFSATQPLGSGVMIDPQTGIISGIAPSSIGDYVVAVVVDEFRNGVKIADNRKELHITVGGCNIPTADLPIRPATCDGFTVNFQNGSTSPAITSYNWDFGVPGISSDTSNQATPTYIYQDTGRYNVTLVVNRGQPCSNTGTQLVRVYPGFFPGFTFNGSCKGIPFSFTDTTRTNYGFVNSWSWNFGNTATLADTSHLQNPQYTYPNTGTYTTQLIVSNSKGCTDSATVPVMVNDKPSLTLPFRDTLICRNDTLQLQAVSGTGQGSFTWTPNYRISSTTIPNPLVSPLVTTFYAVTLNDRNCIATDSIKINVLDSVTIDAGSDTTICRTDKITLQPISQALAYSWTPAATLSNPAIKNPVATPTAASTAYYVTGKVGKCSARDSVVVTTIPYPLVNAGNDTTLCYAGIVSLNGSTNGSTYAWSPARLIRNAASLSTTASPLTTTTFVLTVTDTLGCPKPARDSVLVTVRPQPFVFAGNDTTVILGQPLLFQSVVSSFLTKYLWTPATGLNSDTLLRPTAVITQSLFPASAQITYLLTATSPEGCTASDEIIVKIFTTPPTIFVPGAFTPNGDGTNDIIRPILAGMRQLDYFRVFNRLGQLVFTTSTIGQGWDGLIKGEPQGSAGFVYTIQAIDYTGKVIHKSGSFVLIR